MTTIESYENSFDGTAPLLAHVCFDESSKRMPMVVLMHGFSHSQEHVRDDALELGAKGVFVMAPDMRGHGDSSGKPDCGGLEILDIFMGIRHCIAKYPDRIAPDNVSLWGYSGGGGNGFSCAVRFPDLFSQIAIFFGISDYGRWRNVAPQYADNVDRWVGGTPEQRPHAYAARNVVPAAANNRHSRIHLIWDVEETTCPGFFHTSYFEVARAAGCENIILHESKAGDAGRFEHGYPHSIPGLRRLEENALLPEIRKGGRPCALPDRGRFNVRGFIWTKRFALVLGNAAGTCDLEYDLTPEMLDCRIGNLVAESPKLSVLTFKSAAWEFPKRLRLNGRDVPMRPSGPSELRADLSVDGAR